LTPPYVADNRDNSDFDARSYAAFAQTNYHITDTLRATVGYRYTWDLRDLTRHKQADFLSDSPICIVGANPGTVPGTGTGPCYQPYEAAFSYPAYTVGLDWQITDQTFLYVKSSRASMAGGFNTRAVPPTVSQSFQPETNKDVEVGVKSDMLDKRLRTNLSLFHGWQNDVQRIVNTVFDNTLTQYVANSGKTTTYGAELEITALPWKGMELTASGAYLHAAYVAGTFHEEQALADGTLVTVDRSGEPVPQAPKYTFSFAATQSVNIPIGTLSFHADYSWRDALVYTWDTPAPQLPAAVKAQWNLANQLGVIPSYGIVNARVALNMDNPNLEFAFWGRNLANKEYYTQQFDSYTGLGTSINFQGDPRTYGFTVTYNFK
jgi:iron complex outermembrane receptor protein